MTAIKQEKFLCDVCVEPPLGGMKTFTLSLLVVAGCVVDPEVEASLDSEAQVTAGGMPVLPSAAGSNELSPWGGGNPARWRPEAILANATSQALNDAWQRTDIADAVVAVPARMLDSNFFQFGDGQANVAPSFEFWHDSRPPVIATLLRLKTGSLVMQLRADHAVPNADATWEARYTVNGTTKTVALAITRAVNGDGTAQWNVPDEVGWSSPTSQQVVLVHPKTWGDWFPITFRFPVRTIASLKADVPVAQRRFADGGDLEDHEAVSAQTHSGASTPFERLLGHTFGANYNQQPFTPSDIHAQFPYFNHNYVTGVGMGWTWVANAAAAPFKIMYTCFDKRNAGAEADAPDGGVASGGGWHRIGDPAETILNDLESGPLPAGSAISNPMPASMLPSGGYAYNLSDVVTVRWIKPGEAFVTPAGTTVRDSNGQIWNQSNYHWYFFAGAKPVCTEEWVHPCRPSDYGFSCATQNTVTFHADNAFTQWGQNVFVVGDRPELGAWDATKAVALSPSSYPTWSAALKLPRNASVRFKFIRKDGAGNVSWEGGGDRSFTVPNGDASSAGGAWQ